MGPVGDHDSILRLPSASASLKIPCFNGVEKIEQRTGAEQQTDCNEKPAHRM